MVILIILIDLLKNDPKTALIFRKDCIFALRKN
jgi:hypothetical protein